MGKTKSRNRKKVETITRQKWTWTTQAARMSEEIQIKELFLLRLGRKKISSTLKRDDIRKAARFAVILYDMAKDRQKF